MNLEDLGFEEQRPGLYVKDDVRVTESLWKAGGQWQVACYDKKAKRFSSASFLPFEVVEAMHEAQKREKE